MKRIWILTGIFVALFSLLCLWSCSGSGGGCGCDSVVVGAYNNGSSCCSPGDYSGDAKLSGCHVVNSCIDCYWFPTACGYYENDLNLISHVVCGCDCNFTECYGDSSLKQEKAPDELAGLPALEERIPVLAVEGRDYTIDRARVRVYNGSLQSYTDDEWNWDDLGSLVALVSMLGEDAEIQFTVEYTALRELPRVDLSGDIVYNGHEWTNYTDGFHVTKGNITNELVRRQNIRPGKHVVNAVLSLNMYELIQLEEITDVKFSAYVYEED